MQLTERHVWQKAAVKVVGVVSTGVLGFAVLAFAIRMDLLKLTDGQENPINPSNWVAAIVLLTLAVIGACCTTTFVEHVLNRDHTRSQEI